MNRAEPAAKRAISIIIAALFSFAYLSLYPMLTGNSVIYLVSLLVEYGGDRVYR